MSDRTWDVIGIGENSVDFVYRVPTAAPPGGKIRIAGHQRLFGGQVATSMCACAALGLRAKYVGTFGDDDNGIRIREALVRRGVDCTDALVRAAPNRYAIILIDEGTGERTVLWDRDARLGLRPEEITASAMATTRLLHVDDVDEDAALHAATIARAARIPVTSDIDRVTERTDSLVAAVSVPIFPEHVLRTLTGESDAERALRKLRRRHTGWLCVTLGVEGAMLLEGDQLHRAAAANVTAADTTGAGDVFRGAFVYALLRGDTAEQILRFATAAAGISCTRAGAIDSVPTLDEIAALVRAGNAGSRR